MDNYREQAPFPAQGLYDPRFEHENCGIGAVVNMKGETDRSVVDNALKIVETLEHRAGKDAEGKTNRRQAGIWYWYVLLPTDQGKVRKGNENL